MAATSVEECTEADTSNGMTNKTRAGAIDGKTDNLFYFWGNSLTLPPKFSAAREPGDFYDY
jgi:hypothetical protein